MAFKKGDFVEIEYTGKLADENIIFDTTDEKVAKENNLLNPQAMYGPIVVCIGENQIIKGLDDSLEKLDMGSHDVLIASEDGFGKKNAKLLRLIPLAAFRKQKIEVMPGLQVTVDDHSGIIRTVTGGRVIVDFNHPLSGKDLLYSINVKRKVEKAEEQVDGLLKMMGLGKTVKEITDSKVVLEFPAMLPSPVQDEIQGKIKSLVPSIHAVEFKFPAPEKKEPKKEEKVEKIEAKKLEEKN